MQLPEQFVPAMEMTRPGDMATAYAQSETVVITTNSGGQVVTQPPGNYFITPASQAVTHLSAGGATQTSIVAAATATTTAALDVSPYMHDIGAQGSVQSVGGASASLQATVNTAQQLNAQLARFEREMALKLDYLDERVAKLCYLALSTRLS
ncbi:hypothetical protein ON010_g16531 [Phytophthora cinnamomi]|nr:hypothetical protein ON010_g16531 [Phytophthora cinnamomi]